MFLRMADANVTRGRVQRHVEWDALVVAQPLPFLDLDSCLLPNALAGSFDQAMPFSATVVISICVSLWCPETCDSGSRVSFMSLFLYGMYGAR